jgi:RHS repeat-associated protein
MQRVTKSQKTIGMNAVIIGKTYDSAGRTLTLKYFPGTPQERSYGYTYDAEGHLVNVRDNTGGRDLVQYSNFTAAGQMGLAVFPKQNGTVQTSYTYDPVTTRLSTLVTQTTGQAPATYQNLVYQFDPKGNLAVLADTQKGITHSYGYDELDRLLSATGVGNSPYTQTYSYDAIGNIASKSDVGTYAYTYNNQPHAVRAAGNITLDYDLNGNMTYRQISGGPRLDFTYDFDNKPTVIKKNNIDYIAYTYDGNGQRVRKSNLYTGQETLYFGEAYELRGTVEVFHIFAGSQRVVSIRSDGNEQYYHPNHIGSASVITDAKGNQKEQIEYLPYGTYRQRTDYDGSFPDVNYTFTGQEDDDELGLYNYKARLYDPVLGRFISPDSIVPEPGNAQSLNRYSYCLNNPLIYIDPSGHMNFFTKLWRETSRVVTDVGHALSDPKTLAMIAISALAFYGAGMLIAGLQDGVFGEMCYEVTAVTQAGINAGAGAISGGINAAITGGDVGKGVLTGGLSAGIAKFAGVGLFQSSGYDESILSNTPVNQVASRTLVGGVTGGITSEIYGGSFGQGFGQGAYTAGMAYLFNQQKGQFITFFRTALRTYFSDAVLDTAGRLLQVPTSVVGILTYDAMNPASAGWTGEEREVAYRVWQQTQPDFARQAAQFYDQLNQSASDRLQEMQRQREPSFYRTR